mmetsp:Transcript_14991/g.51500  ORF Transcript_14991/g.51500 Transcript_14991/m.51500 type:complete len:441 (+) Transcript_14991:85-1407(+)
MGPVDCFCTFRFRLGLSPSGSTAGPLLSFQFRDGQRFEATPHGPRHSKFDAIPALCEYAGDEAPAAGSVAPAQLMVANSVEYLFLQWPNFLNRILFANAAKERTFIWIGELPAKLATTVGDACESSRQWAEVAGLMGVEARRALGVEAPRARRGLSQSDSQNGGARSLRSVYYDRGDGLNASKTHSNHYNKMLGSTLLLKHPWVDGVFYCDLDSYYSRQSLTSPAKHRLLHDGGRWDVAFRGMSVQKPFWLVKGSKYYARKSDLAEAFFGNWIEQRCGFKDQWSLWHTVLQSVRAAGCVQYRDEMLSVTSFEAMKSGTKLWPHLAGTMPSLLHKCPALRFSSSVGLEQPTHRSVATNHTSLKGLLQFDYTPNSQRRPIEAEPTIAGKVRSLFVANLFDYDVSAPRPKGKDVEPEARGSPPGKAAVLKILSLDTLDANKLY